MPPLDTLVKLAAIGTSGICIFAIFWSGWLIYKTTDAAKLETIKYFIAKTVVIAVISALSGGLNAAINVATIRKLEAEQAAAVQALSAQQDSLTLLRRRGTPP
jgi:formate hydrogenlyase subunit 3/multisubunit Na+/H+ antiporter MnhD subunit